MRTLISSIQQVGLRLKALLAWGSVFVLFHPAPGLCDGASISITPLISGLSEPVDITHAGDGSERLFIAERSGRILIWQGGTLLATPFLDIRSLTITDGERGLLGMAFHPDFVDNGQFFIHYSDGNGDTVVSRYTISEDLDQADSGSARIILQVAQPASNHNGGQIRFGPDGFLYIALGDGGFGGDPQDNAQDLSTLLGKLLRIDVDNGAPYAIPDDNPFVGQSGVRPEIWTYGLRNPWRFSFDRKTGDLFMADVGQAGFEEINYLSAESTAGTNYGWRLMEGFSCFNPASECNPGNLTPPIIVYDHTVGRSITGGYRYRGQLYPELDGLYIFGDFITGKIFTAEQQPDKTWNYRIAAETELSISTFGEDEQGELYVTHFDADNGAVYEIKTDQTTKRDPDSHGSALSISSSSGCFLSIVHP